jgi:hyperosmotically inducible protein
MIRILAAIFALLVAAPWASAAEQPIVPRAGDDVPSATTPASPEAQAIAQSTVNDDAITRSVAAAVLSDPRLTGADVSVNTVHGIVSLTGNVRSREQAVAALEQAEAPDGVMRVDNQLSVILP